MSLLTTALHARHEALNAKMVDFAGWHMPLQYGSLVDEHHAVRKHAGMFDVSHMLPVDFSGSDCTNFLQKLLASDVAKLGSKGSALYTAMLNDNGGIIDDLIVYRLDENRYRVIFNAGCADSDMEWVKGHQDPQTDVDVTPRRDLNILAVQGPEAIAILSRVLDYSEVRDLTFFESADFDDFFVARTGYTGEDGAEILCSEKQVKRLWKDLLESGVTPCGLGARDTLRLEAGLNLNGQDMSPEVSPFECALSWVVHWAPEDRHFIGRSALTDQRESGSTMLLKGIVLQGGVMRHGQAVHTAAGPGTITSGSYSPTLKQSVALARLPRDAKGQCEVEIRNRRRVGEIVRPPFVRKGRRVYK